MIVTISADINTSEDPECSAEEKNSLKEAETLIDEGLASIEAYLKELETALEGKSQKKFIFLNDTF